MKIHITATIAAVCAIAMGLLLSVRNDGEITTRIDETGTFTASLSPHSDITLFVCATDQAQLPSHLDFDNAPIELIGPRPLDVPHDFAHDKGLDSRLQCGVSEVFKTPDEGQNHVIQTNPNLFLVIAVNDPTPTTPIACLFALFLVAFGMTFALAAQKYRLPCDGFRAFDGILGVFIAMGTAFLLSILVFQHLPHAPQLFPAFGEMIAMFAINTVSFIGVFVAFIAVRSRNAQAPILQEIPPNDEREKRPTESPTQTPIPTFNPLTSLGIGVALAALAALSVSLAPLPGLSTTEMASQLTSTLYVTALFAVLAGLSEECLFRGLVQSSLEAKPHAAHPLRQNAAAILFTTILFVGVHVAQSLDHLWALIPIAIVSLTNGVLKVKYRSLFPAILVHMTYNATLLLPSLIAMG